MFILVCKWHLKKLLQKGKKNYDIKWWEQKLIENKKEPKKPACRESCDCVQYTIAPLQAQFLWQLKITNRDWPSKTRQQNVESRNALYMEPEIHGEFMCVTFGAVGQFW